MIKGLFETHLFVSELNKSIDFYCQILNLKLAHVEPERGAAFFWIGKPKQAMLGLWEKPKEQIVPSHFAFETSPEFVLHEAVPFLNSKGIEARNFFKDGSSIPMVFAWLPAISIYFDDPDGHSLEYIGLLEGDSQPDLGVVSYETWQNSL